MRSIARALVILASVVFAGRLHAQQPTRGTFELADDAGPLARGTLEITWFARDSGADAGQPLDAAAPVDSGPRDSGTFPDASSPTDAGVPPPIGSAGCGIARSPGVVSRT